VASSDTASSTTASEDRTVTVTGSD
jgi:hypothetical protein